MIAGEIRIDTTWVASTSFIPFPAHIPNAQDYKYGGIDNRGIYATTAWVSGIWERSLWEMQFDGDVEDDWDKHAHYGTWDDKYGNSKVMRGLSWIGNGNVGNAFEEGTVLEVKVRKIKALKSSPNRSGIQVNHELVQGNKLVFRYVSHGEIVRPM